MKETDLVKMVYSFIEEIQEVADSKELEFNAGVMTVIMGEQFEEYHSKQIDRRTLERKADYMCCKANELLEAMVIYYNKGGKK